MFYIVYFWLFLGERSKDFYTWDQAYMKGSSLFPTRDGEVDDSIWCIFTSENQFDKDKYKLCTNIYREMASRDILISYVIWWDEHYTGRCFLHTSLSHQALVLDHDMSLKKLLFLLLLSTRECHLVRQYPMHVLAWCLS